MNKVIFVIITAILLTLNLSACEEEKVSANTESYVYYDMETSTHKVSLQNGENQTIATFQLFVESNRDDLTLSQINFRLRGNGYTGEEEELEFYDALDNFTVIINGQEIIPIESSTLILPQFDIPINETTEIEIKADVRSNLPEVHGYIMVERVFISHPGKEYGVQYPDKFVFEPSLGVGTGTETCINKLYGEDEAFIPYWKVPEITITNNAINTEECTDVEVKLNNGQCVYNQCEGISCGNGDCAMNLNSGAAQCDCQEGFGTWDNGMISCDQRLARFDIETTNQDLPVNNNTNGVIIGEWNITINEAEDAELAGLFFKMHGAKHSFSNFRLGIMHPEEGYISFGGIENENQHSELSEDQDDMSIIFSIPIDGENIYSLTKGSITMIRLIADIHGTAGESITAKIQYAGIRSKDVFSFEYGKALYADFQLGNSSLESAVIGSGYLEQWHPTATIQ